ncbi:hypothetical protein QWZ03_01835 [Chitinimonas viridis]|uniref:Uncharacterized protein n=1 Tax=Chitinimonas viridis TaxID=664880 RepID=A0ABT8B079_9NEIS|nr:hypothetical protein [Chitinimonas viridis]MDN3575511.1 hypothetical protein [Chitinimonas viridis]
MSKKTFYPPIPATNSLHALMITPVGSLEQYRIQKMHRREQRKKLQDLSDRLNQEQDPLLDKSLFKVFSPRAGPLG